MHCPNCNYELDDTTKFCTLCGAKLDSGAGHAPAPYVIAPKKKSIVPTIVLAVVLIICVAAAAVFLPGILTDGGGSERADRSDRAIDEPEPDTSRFPQVTNDANAPSATAPQASPPETPSESPVSPTPELPSVEITPDIVEAPPVTYPDPVFEMTIASDFTPATSMGSYEPGKATDGDTDTAWQVPEGNGHWIALTSGTMQYVSGVRILNGFTFYSDQRGDWLYYWNARPGDITISFSDGSSISYTLDDNFEGGVYNYQEIHLPEPVLTQIVHITIDSYHPGSRWQDICISEIEVF